MHEFFARSCGLRKMKAEISRIGKNLRPVSAPRFVPSRRPCVPDLPADFFLTQYVRTTYRKILVTHPTRPTHQ